MRYERTDPEWPAIQANVRRRYRPFPHGAVRRGIAGYAPVFVDRQPRAFFHRAVLMIL
jgi:hypothetical protein